MRHRLLTIATLVTPLLLTGCMRQMSSTTTWRSEFTSVPVRFVMTPESGWYTEADVPTRTHLVADGTYDGLVDEGFYGDMTAAPWDAVHVALWGGPFEGRNVTYGVTPLTPGSYTFAFVDRDNASLMQGWLDVRSTGDNMLDMLYNWKENISQQRWQIAYDYEISGRTRDTDSTTIKSFNKQLRALYRLERRIDATIAAELRARIADRKRTYDLLRDAEVLIVPGDEAVFHPATRAAFNEAELADIRNGGTVTKLVLAADYDDAQWKLRRVSQLYGDLARWKEVLREEVNRLERRKGLMLLTDHLHNYDQRFVENEMRLERVLGHIDRVDEHMKDLRERRLGLAFITELVAPDGTFRTLEQEQQTLLQERAVLDAEKQRLNRLFNEADQDSTKRVSLERNRQRVLAALDTIDYQLGDLSEARTALASMVNSTEVIHRVGDTRLLATTFVANDLPFYVRRAAEAASLMTAKLEYTDNVFVPQNTSVTTTKSPTSTWRERHSTRRSEQGWHSDHPSAVPEPTARLVHQPKPQEYNPPEQQCEPCWTEREQNRCDCAPEPTARLVHQPEPQEDNPPKQQCEPCRAEREEKKCNKAPFVRWLVPPCWFSD